MCLIVLAHRAHADYPLVVAANRDEAHARPTAPAAWWDGEPPLLAGRDLSAGGTWMGVTRDGRFAAVTNFREWPPEAAERSRGALVTGFLRSADSPEAYAAALSADGSRYAGFNLLLSDGASLVYVSNRLEGWRVLGPGVHALSNHLLDTPWPKVVRARRAMHAALDAASGDALDPPLWELLADRVAAADDELPDTGVGRERELLLSPPFIAGDLYGTRSSTVLTVSSRGDARFVERTVAPGREGWTEVRETFRMGG